MGKCSSLPNPNNKKNSIYSTSRISNSEEFKMLKQIPNFPMTTLAKTSVISSISKYRIFDGLSNEGFEVVLKHVQYCIAEKEQILFTQGSTGSLFFIINSGRVEVIINNQKVNTLEKDACFGEMALLSDSIRKATIRTINKCSFWVLSCTSFFEALKLLYKKNYDQIRKIVNKSVFFKDLPDSRIDLLSKSALRSVYENEEVIIREGDIGDSVFLLISGCVGFRKKSEVLFKINQPGEVFGEGAVLSKDVRKASCVAHGRTEVISIDSTSLKEILGEDFNIILMRNIAFYSISRDPHLKFIENEQVLEICLNFQWKKMNDKELLLEKTEKSLHSFIVVCSGAVGLSGVKESCLNPYQTLGLGNLNEQNMAPGMYYSIGESIVGEIAVKSINKILKIDTKKMFFEIEKIRFLRGVVFFQSLSLESIRLIAANMKLFNIAQSQQVFAKNNRATKVYVVKSGTFEVYDDSGNLLRIAKQLDVFGERCLYEDLRSANVYCVEQGQFYSVSKSALFGLPDYNDLLLDAKRRGYYQKKIDLKLADILGNILSSAGRKKYCIKACEDGSKYDLVVISKYMLKNKKDCIRLTYEKEVMLQVDHRQLLKMVCTYFDRNNIYFITEHINGTSLSHLLPIPLITAKNITIHLALLLQYMHNKHIIYRDLATTNILISSKGIPYLYNFRSSKIAKNRAYSRVGIPFYRSPEMILARGYTKSTDIWSLGVVIYEMVYNKLPFSMSYSDPPTEAYEKILKVRHGFSDLVSSEINDLLQKILCNSDNRIDIDGILKSEWTSYIEKIPGRRPTLPLNVFSSPVKGKGFVKLKIEIDKVFENEDADEEMNPEVERFEWDKYF